MTVNTKRSKVPLFTCCNNLWLPNFTRFCSTAIRFWVTGHFETNAPNEPNDLWTPKGLRYSIHILQLPRLSTFTRFRSMPIRFWITGHFETSALNYPEMTLNTKRSKVPKIHITTTPRLPNVNQFHSTAIFFQVKGHFVTNLLNDPKLTLNPKRSKVPPYIQVTATPELQILLRCALKPAVFELQAILRQVHRMTPKWPSTLKGPRYSIYVLPLPQTLKFPIRFTLRPAVFELLAVLRQVNNIKN